MRETRRFRASSRVGAGARGPVGGKTLVKELAVEGGEGE